MKIVKILLFLIFNLFFLNNNHTIKYHHKYNYYINKNNGAYIL